jgi:hypothetical protein
MAIKTFSPPTVDQARTLQLWSPGGFIIQIREADILDAYSDHDDEALARAYCEMTGMRVTVQYLRQTTVAPTREAGVANAA